jgi:hypothetical protein
MQAEAVKTGAVEREVQQFVPGKIGKEKEIKEETEENNLLEDTSNKDFIINTVTENTTEEVLMEEMVTENKQVHVSKLVTYFIIFLCFQIVNMDLIDHAIETIQDCIMKDVNHGNINIIESSDEDDDNIGESENLFIDWKDSVKSEGLKNEQENVIAKTDGLMGHIIQEVVIDELADSLNTKANICNSDALITSKGPNLNDNSSDDSSDDESEDEYMSDGELVRKNARGFKQLVNCKKFWVASQIIGKRKEIILRTFI